MIKGDGIFKERLGEILNLFPRISMQPALMVEFLLRRPGMVCPYEVIGEVLWPNNEIDWDEDNVPGVATRLRVFLRAAEGDWSIKTRWGVGYMIIPPEGWVPPWGLLSRRSSRDPSVRHRARN